ncbi:MAG: hypothetical protein IPO40_23625 [Fibrobacteres bacterium]|nr:hypothetical protein [Fibrobacterota bacterium]
MIIAIKKDGCSMKMLQWIFLALILAPLSWSGSIGRRCPNAQIEKNFNDGTYLLERVDDQMLVCRRPDIRDSLLLAIGIFTRDSLYDRITGIRYFKYNNSAYSAKDIKDAFYTDLSKCNLRTDGLFDCFSSQNNGVYYSVTDSKNAFPWIEYHPKFRAAICGDNFGVQFDFLAKLSKKMSVANHGGNTTADGLYITMLFLDRMDSLRLGKEINRDLKIGPDSSYRITTRVNNSVVIAKCSNQPDSAAKCRYLNEIFLGDDVSYIFSLLANCDNEIAPIKKQKTIRREN